MSAAVAEPVLTERDHYLWNEVWVPAFLDHAQTQAFRRRLEVAKSIVREGVAKATALAGSFSVLGSVSAGKDSTAMGELISGEMGFKIRYVSEKDDLDYPGELEHLRLLEERWGVKIEVLTPPVSLAQAIRELAAQGLRADDDIHGRAAELSKQHFYSLMERANEGAAVVCLGLRAEESKGRRMNRMTRGPLYELRTGRWHCCPLADWLGIDVLAYCVSRGVPLLPLYRCIGFKPEHVEKPWLIRKSWWLPGVHSRFGDAAWLKHYYPSLWRVFLQIWPTANGLGG